MYYFMIFCLLLNITWANSTIYMKKDQFNNITYSDTPLDNAEKISLPNNINQSPSLETNQPTEPTIPLQNATSSPYEEFMISSPKDNDTIQNQTLIPVKINLKPELRTGEKIQLIVDGKEVSAPTTLTQTEIKVESRGAHQLSAVIMNNKEVIQKSNIITFYLQRANINLSPAFKKNS